MRERDADRSFREGRMLVDHPDKWFAFRVIENLYAVPVELLADSASQRF